MFSGIKNKLGIGKDKDKDKEKEEEPTEKEDTSIKESKKEESKIQEDPKEDNPQQPQQQPLKSDPTNFDSVIVMKKGDYTVHVLIEEIKNCIELKQDKLPYPVVKITCLDKSQRTEKTSLPCTEYIFNEHFYFSKTNLTAEMLDSEKIIIEAYDHSHCKRKDYFGIYEFDFEYIYNRPDHALHNFWLALANPENDDVTQVRGYLKLSISVLHSNDPRVELEYKESDSSNCMVPSQAKLHYKQLSIHLFKAEEIPDMDAVLSEKKVGRRCDGYVEVKYLGITRKTRVVEMKKEIIEWNEVIDIPVSVPAVSQKIVMIIKDKDVGTDDIVGSIELRINDILNNKYSELTYINIYGSPLNKRGGYFDQMNYNAEVGSRWKGRILMKIDIADVDSPISAVRPIEDHQLLQSVYSKGRTNLWSIYFNIYGTYFLPDEKYYGIRLSIQENDKFFPGRKAENRNIEWNVDGSLQCWTLSADKDELPDLFIYLTSRKGDEHLCFQRIKPSFFHLNKDIMVIKLLPDPCIGKVKSNMDSGLIKIKMCLHNKAADPPLDVKEFQSDGGNAGGNDDDELENLVMSNVNKPQTTTIKNFTVVAIVYMSRYLIAADADGTSDPYVTLTMGKQSLDTSIKSNTVNGIWNERLVFTDVQFDTQDKSTWPIAYLKVMDYNKILSNVAIGYNYVWLSEAAYTINDTELVRPKWHNLFLPKSNKMQGQIMLSFYLFTDDKKDMINKINYLPETIPYTCELNILGLRDLKPLSLLPVKKAFIKFDMNSLNVTGKREDALQPVSTVPTATGENPTINTVITFDARLPKDKLFIPQLQCEVYDHLLSGMTNSLLGVFTIDIRKIIKRTKLQIEEDLKLTKLEFGLGLTKSLIRQSLLSSHHVQSVTAVQGESGMNELPQQPSSSSNNELLLSTTGANMQGELPSKDNNNNIIINVEPQRKTLSEFNAVAMDAKFLKAAEFNSDFFVVYPVMKDFVIPGYRAGENKEQKEIKIEDESKAPDASSFFKIGFLSQTEQLACEKPEDSAKHYRRIFREPLENVKELKLKSPFIKSKLKRGKYQDKTNETSLFEAMADINSKVLVRYGNEVNENGDERSSITLSSGPSQSGFMGDNADDAEKYYGRFKGFIRICEKQQMTEYIETTTKCRDKLQFKNLNKYEQLRTKILSKRTVIVRVYVLELNNLAKKDLLSESDPYIKLFLNGKEIINEKDNHQDDQKNCKWYKHYDIPTEIPGASTLTLQVWDYDDLLSDDLIGETTIDLEDRYFDDKWQELKYKPIEVRPLLHPDINGSQGEAYMWLEIIDKELNEVTPLWKIQPEPVIQHEMRFVVWETEDMEIMDIEGTSDIYVIGYVDMKEKQSTDVHYRCQTGSGSFNWRMLLPVQTPNINSVLTIQVYDNDLFSTDDYICGATIDFKSLLDVPKLIDLPVKFTRDYYQNLTEEEKRPFGEIEFLTKDDDEEGIKFWVQCYKDGKKGGRVMCSLEIIPQWKARMNQVGKGRDEPNLDPYLPPPVGRLSFTLNPFKMLNQLAGPKFRRKMYCGICMILLVLYLIYFLPYLVLHISGEALYPF